ncbi:MAG: acyl--CoA ligase [Acholeplasmatales bacterium]|nr:acyl--CoA ligase [Acholeplasmatales bacterium]
MSCLKKYSNIYSMIIDHDEDSIALTYDDDKTITSIYYGELEEKIISYPINSDALMVGIICDNTIDTIIAILAYLYYKKTIVLLSAKEKIEALQEKIDRVGIDYIEGPDRIKKDLRPSTNKYEPLDYKIIFFTATKAVILTEEKLCLSAYNGSLLMPLKPNDELYSCLPLNYVYGFVCSWLWAWQNGASIILNRGTKELFNDFKYFRPTVVALVPQLASAFLLRNSFNRELRFILLGGGDCTEATLKALYDKGIRFSYGYGLTETSSGVAMSMGINPRAFKVCPMDDIILDDDDEILIKCDKLIFDGYYPDNSSYNESFTEDGYFKTGDLGYFDDDHNLHLKGRKKDLLVLPDGSKILLNVEEKKIMDLIHIKELAIGLNNNAEVTLCLGKTSKEDLSFIKEEIVKYNEDVIREHRITKIITTIDPLPKDQNGKIKRFEINYN